MVSAKVNIFKKSAKNFAIIFAIGHENSLISRVGRLNIGR